MIEKHWKKDEKYVFLYSRNIKYAVLSKIARAGLWLNHFQMIKAKWFLCKKRQVGQFTVKHNQENCLGHLTGQKVDFFTE